jgi:glycosyltransferase involved in cell wall biosynthesis
MPYEYSAVALETSTRPAHDICPAAEDPAQAAVRILAIWTRELDATEHFGRVNIARQVRASLQDIGIATNRCLTNVFEEPRPIWSLLWSVAALLAGLLCGRPLPLQCALFAAAARRPELLEDGLDVDVVYLDGIRTLLLMRRLLRVAPRLRMVVDLDDLMSRRYEQLSRLGLPFSLGYLERLLPRSLSRLAVAKGIARMVLWYERLALRNAEREVLRMADSVVLLNRSEAAMLREVASKMSDSRQATVVAIPPMAKPVGRAIQSTMVRVPNGWRAVFVGSDVLVQNHLPIDHLLDLWASAGIDTKLHIYGRQKRRWPDTQNVTFHGYVADIEEAYTPGSILVYPCLVPGGIKTKVLEAFAHGIPVIGNALTFEGILPKNYPLVIDDQAELVALLKDPVSRVEDLVRATHIGSSYVAQEHTAQAFERSWRQVILGTAGER